MKSKELIIRKILQLEERDYFPKIKEMAGDISGAVSSERVCHSTLLIVQSETS